MIINLAAGGDCAGYPDETTPDNAKMYVHYARGYAKEVYEDPGDCPNDPNAPPYYQL